MAVRRKQIRQLVESLLDKHNVSHGPVPVQKIARAFKIEIKLDQVDDDLSGFLFRDKRAGRTVIGANKRHHENRQRFTIAHELGHYLLHEGETVHLDNQRGAFTINLRNSDSGRGKDDSEREANLFAAELLMPTRFLEEELNGKNLDLLEDNNFLNNLAKKYQVSVQALTFRLANLGYIEPLV
jgi:Zn-dependent peptidase ImmA (M78 family)